MSRKQVKYTTIVCACLIIAFLAWIYIVNYNRSIALKKTEVKGIIARVKYTSDRSRSGVTIYGCFITVTGRVNNNGRLSAKDYFFNMKRHQGELEVGDSIYKPANSVIGFQYKRNADTFKFYQALQDILVDLPL